MIRDEQIVERREGRLAERLGDDLLLAPIGMVFWRMKGAFERELGVSPGTWFTLAMLCEEDGISQGEMGQRFELDPSRITRLAQRLEKKGLLLRKRDPEDNRVVRIHLTGEGRNLLERLRDKRESFEERIRGALSEDEQEQFRRTLDALAAAMEG